VIVISAMIDMGSVVQGVRLGAEDYVPKPFDDIVQRARFSGSLERKNAATRKSST
jgi:DNA-binding response OmpR family regulator